MRSLYLLLLTGCFVLAQNIVVLPDMAALHQETVKADRKHNVEDAHTIATLAAEVQAEMDHDDANVVSLKTIKKLEEMERLSKRIRGRLKRDN